MAMGDENEATSESRVGRFEGDSLEASEGGSCSETDNTKKNLVTERGGEGKWR